MYEEFPLVMEAEYNPRTGRAEGTPVCVGFGLHPIEDAAATERAGRPVYRDEVFVKIVVPGDRTTVVLTKAKEEHKRRFPQAWAAYERREHQAVEGTPLEQWPAMSRALALTLKAAHIHTVEALAAVHDGHLENLGWDAREWRAKAKAYLDGAEKGAAAQKLASENEVLRAQIAEMQSTLARLQERYDKEFGQETFEGVRKAARK